MPRDVVNAFVNTHQLVSGLVDINEDASFYTEQSGDSSDNRVLRRTNELLKLFGFARRVKALAM